MGIFDFFSRRFGKKAEPPSGRMGFRGGKLVNLPRPIVSEKVLGGLFGAPPSRPQRPQPPRQPLPPPEPPALPPSIPPGFHGGENKGESIYGYEPVGLQMARSFFHTSSKGKWVWDNLRIRGTKYGHKVNYYFDQGMSTKIPLYRLEGGARERHHDAQAIEQGGKYTGYFEGIVTANLVEVFNPNWRG